MSLNRLHSRNCAINKKSSLANCTCGYTEKFLRERIKKPSTCPLNSNCGNWSNGGCLNEGYCTASKTRICGGCQALTEAKKYTEWLEKQVGKLQDCIQDFAAKCDRLEGQKTDIDWFKEQAGDI